ncbi:uncharacterized protein LOC117327715 [Pecten maximus]|uniref:uncharacterized protein LOC117327715 n=1 Tax=Pecten maximus TaxID=6579 RepID=UPI0014589604|nr:uncharacterized protein LOC117327715 [Pecten maximus]
MVHDAICVLLVLQAMTISSSLEPCNDVNTAVCHMMATKDSSLCSNSCLRSLCKRFCGTCPPQIECFQCSQVRNPNTCNTTVTCAKLNETCFVSEYTDVYSNTLYQLGCAPKQVCVDHFNYNETLGMTIIHGSDDQGSGACCGSNLCNNQTHRDLINIAVSAITMTTTAPLGMRRSLYVRSESECADMGTDICTLLSHTVPDMCENPCILAVVCPRTCQRCLSCHTCEHANQPSGCNQTRICEEGQLCYSLKTISLMLEHGYRLGCMDKYICDRFHKEAPIAFGRRGRQSLELSLNGGCCSTDLCNNRELHGDVTSLPVSLPLITSTMTPPVDLGTSTTARLCPASHTNCSDDFMRHGTDCYHTSRQTMDWDMAKGYCHEKCAELVKFSSADFALQVLQQLYFSGGLEEMYFTDAQYNVNSDGWEWSSTGEAIPSSLLPRPVNITNDICGAVGIRRYYHGLTINFPPTDCLLKLPSICQISLL